MMRCLPALALLIAAVLPGAARAAASAPAAPEHTASAPAPRTVGDIVAQLGAGERLQRSALESLPTPAQWAGRARRLQEVESAFGRYEPPPDRAEATDQLLGRAHDLWALGNEAAEIVRDLGTLVQRIERASAALQQDAAQWQEAAAILQERQAPGAALDAVQALMRQGQSAAERLRATRDQVLLALVRAQALQLRVHEATAQVAARVEHVVAERSRLESEPLWRLAALDGERASLAERLAGSAALLRSYFAREGAQLALAFGAVFALCLWLFRRAGEGAAPAAQRGYGRPVASALLLALLALAALAPSPPVLLYSLLLVVLPVPVALIARGTVAARIPRTVAGIAAATMLMAMRSIVDASPLADRLLLLLQIGTVSVPLLLDLRSGRLQQALARWSAESVRTAVLVILAAAALSALHALVGMGGSLRSVRVGIAGLVGFGVIFGTGAAVLYGALLALLGTPLLGWLRSARQRDPALLRALRAGVALAAAAATVVATLGAMTLVPETLAAVDGLARGSVDVGAVTLSVSTLVAAAAVVAGSFLLNALVQFVLDREVFPRLQLRPGLGYAVATFTRWLILIVGAVLALAALGVDATRITLLAGALGVGIGFGLQTVVNNFVSGLILIVERPVAVGDLIEIGPLLGEIQRIGIRSSSVRTTHGAEVIVPNSDLASKEVINWTRSDRQRRYDIDVGVAYGSDPELVMRLLVEAAGEVPEVMKQPAPMALFRGFGESSLDFRLLAWVATIDLGLQAQNALRVAVLAKLDAAGIPIPFPQRDVRLVGATA